MMKKLAWIFLIALTLEVATVKNSIVFAEEPVSNEFTLEEITVTAEKRAVNLQSIPLSVSAVTGEDMQKMGRTTISEMLRDTAGVEMRGTGGLVGVFYIRGVGENTSGMGVEKSVSLNTNGVVSTATQAERISSYDVARVEVTRGPDSTLNGRTAEGGSISIITNEPKHNFEGAGSLQLGNYNYFSTQGVLNVPTGEKIAMRAAFVSVRSGGYMSNGQNDINNFSSRVRGLYEPTNALKIVLTAEYNYIGGNGRTSSYTGPIDLSKPFTTPHGAYYAPTQAPSYNLGKAYNYYADITYNFGWASLYFQPSYQTTDFDSAQYSRGYTANSTDQIPDTWDLELIAREQDQKSFELRLTSPDEGRFKWLVGLFYNDFVEYQAISRPAPPNATTMPAIQYIKIDKKTTTARFGKDKAAYAQGTYEFSDTLSLNLGARYTRIIKSRPYATSNTWYYPLDDHVNNQTNGTRILYATEAEKNEVGRFDYKLSIQKKLTPGTMVYALTSTGFKGGGFNLLPANKSILAPGFTTAYGPEVLTSYEIGAKNQLLENKLRINASAFFYNYKDMQLGFNGYAFLPSTGVDPDFTRSVIQNAGRAISYGSELETEYLITSQDRVSLNVSFLHTKIKEISAAPLQFLMGMALPQSPSWRLNLGYLHSVDLGSGMLTAEIDGSYVTKAIFQVPSYGGYNPYNIRDAYFKSNATLTYYPNTSQWSLTGYVRNVFDKQNYDVITPPRVYSGYANVAFTTADPRTYGLTLNANF
jgi:iron complex outermembrane recepter protein